MRRDKSARYSGEAVVGLVLALWLAGAAAPAMAQKVEILDLLANDLIYDPVSDRIYASVPGSAGPVRGNTITTINPYTGHIVSSVWVGSEPGPLATSDDSRFLYVGLDGEGAIRRYGIASANPGLHIRLGVDPANGPFFADDIEVLPGSPLSIAVARRLYVSPRHAGVVVYDNDVMRPNTTQGHTGSNAIEFADFATRLYGNDTEGYPSGLRTIAVDISGAVETSVEQGLLYIGDIEFAEGLIYFSTGQVVDPLSMSLIGDYLGPVDVAETFAVDAAVGQVYFLSTKSELTIFDMATFMPVVTIPINGIDGSAGSLVRWGSDGLAFRTTGGQVFLVSELSSGPTQPDCIVTLSKVGYSRVLREPVVATELRLINPTDEPLEVEVKLWVETPNSQTIATPIPLRIDMLASRTRIALRQSVRPSTGAAASDVLLLPANSDQDFGPVTVMAFSSSLALGGYEFSCRVLDPVTGVIWAESTTPFSYR